MTKKNTNHLIINKFTFGAKLPPLMKKKYIGYLPSPGFVLTTGKGGVGGVRLRPCLALPFLRRRKLKGRQFFLFDQTQHIIRNIFEKM